MEASNKKVDGGGGLAALCSYDRNGFCITTGKEKEFLDCMNGMLDSGRVNEFQDIPLRVVSRADKIRTRRATPLDIMITFPEIPENIDEGTKKSLSALPGKMLERNQKEGKLDHSERNALMIAIDASLTDVATYLCLLDSASQDVIDFKSRSTTHSQHHETTPLMVVALNVLLSDGKADQKKHLTLMKKLLEKGADPNISTTINEKKVTVFDLIEDKGSKLPHDKITKLKRDIREGREKFIQEEHACETGGLMFPNMDDNDFEKSKHQSSGASHYDNPEQFENKTGRNNVDSGHSRGDLTDRQTTINSNQDESQVERSYHSEDVDVLSAGINLKDMKGFSEDNFGGLDNKLLPKNDDVDAVGESSNTLRPDKTPEDASKNAAKGPGR